MSRCFSCSVLLATALVTGTRVAPARAADPPVPSAAHPRLFMSATNLAGLSSNARTPGTSAARIVARCQDSIDHAEFYAPRGGVDADTWPGSAVACAFAYLTLNDAKYLTPALKYWKAALNDDQNIGDSLGCTAANDTFEWKNQWDGNYPPPPVLVTVTHDTGYPMRWYGPFLALTYDWLYSAP